MRARSTPSVSATSFAVKSEFTITTSHACAAWRYFAPCMRAVRRCTQSGKWSGTRSWIIVERMPLRWGGYIQSLKWKTSSVPANRSTEGTPSRDHAVRTACAAGSTGSRSSTSTPRRDSSISRRPEGEAGANATSSAPPAAAMPCSEPRM
ncbi:MAG: hypothetical protein E6F98_03705 [Actinobacteria bacterium]|nr:MAG: hypothetical protein E6F98_03705 [Actinomycetota bacterium]